MLLIFLPSRGKVAGTHKNKKCRIALKMSDFYSDEEFEEETARDPEPMVVEVRGRGTRGSPVTARRSSSRRSHRRESNDDEDDDDFIYDDDDDDDSVVNTTTARSSARARRTARNVKAANGKRAVNMTPPDKLFEKANRMAKKFSASKKGDKAIQERVKALALARIVYGNAHWRLAEAHVNLAEDYLELKGKYIENRIFEHSFISL
ncbi:TeTratriCopeptide repeat [Mactra antiquata]